MKSKILAVDFDGTIVEDKYPKVGKPMLFAVETLQKLHNEGYQLILWTYRSGQALEDAIGFCKKNGIELASVNSSFSGEVFDEKTQSRKINADYFIDDRNLGGFPGWGEVYQILTEKIEFTLSEHGEKKARKKKRGWF
jgi:hydroxymethylpyrimidine pyrophosphatase-like HAD family hydrolase